MRWRSIGQRHGRRKDKHSRNPYLHGRLNCGLDHVPAEATLPIGCAVEQVCHILGSAGPSNGTNEDKALPHSIARMLR